MTEERVPYGGKTKRNTSQWLTRERMSRFYPTVAVAIGLNEAIFIEHLERWLMGSDKVHDGRVWVYNTFEKWQKQLPFWSERTIQRIVASLVKKGIVVTGNYNRHKYDQTLWYSIDYDRLDELVPTDSILRPEASPLRQADVMDNDPVSSPIPSITTERSNTITAPVLTALASPPVATLLTDDKSVSYDSQQHQQERNGIELDTTGDTDAESDDYSTLSFLADEVIANEHRPLTMRTEPTTELPKRQRKTKPKHGPCTDQDKEVLAQVMFRHTNYALLNGRMWGDLYAVNDALVTGGIALHQVLAWHNEVWTKTWPGNLGDRGPTQTELLGGVGAYVAKQRTAAPAEEHVLITEEEEE